MSCILLMGMGIGLIVYKSKLKVHLQNHLLMSHSAISKLVITSMVKILQFQNVSGKYDDGVDNTIKQFYQLNDDSIKCGDLIELYETIVQQLDFQLLN